MLLKIFDATVVILKDSEIIRLKFGIDCLSNNKEVQNQINEKFGRRLHFAEDFLKQKCQLQISSVDQVVAQTSSFHENPKKETIYVPDGNVIILDDNSIDLCESESEIVDVDDQISVIDLIEIL